MQTIKSQISHILFANHQIKASLFSVSKSPNIIINRLITALPNRCQIRQLKLILDTKKVIMKLTLQLFSRINGIKRQRRKPRKNGAG
jgi:hypothetical protein